jgi:predicted phosphodiesterase
MKFRDFLKSFERLLSDSPREQLAAGGRYLFLSDLHLGDGGKKDDLQPNRDLVEAALSRWYLERGSILVLNGDIEDMSKFRLREIQPAWASFFRILDAFHAAGRLRKIIGNHDLALLGQKGYPYPLLPSLALDWRGRTLFAFHGHQASRFFVEHDQLSDLVVRFLAKPLSIRNTSVSGNSRYRYNTERLIYRASQRLGLLSLAGHTHRPLFESQSKYDSLRFSIEALLREYPGADPSRREAIAGLVRVYRAELGRLGRRERRLGLAGGLYSRQGVVVPTLFNSGCGTGKTGFTALELEDEVLSLVQWTGAEGPREYVADEALESSSLPDTPYRRYVLRRAGLEDIFARIELLGRD